MLRLRWRVATRSYRRTGGDHRAPLIALSVKTLDGGQDRAAIDEVLVHAWNALFQLFDQPGAEGPYAHDFNKMDIDSAKTAYLYRVSTCFNRASNKEAPREAMLAAGGDEAIRGLAKWRPLELRRRSAETAKPQSPSSSTAGHEYVGVADT